MDPTELKNSILVQILEEFDGRKYSEIKNQVNLLNINEETTPEEVEGFKNGIVDIIRQELMEEDQNRERNDEDERKEEIFANILTNFEQFLEHLSDNNQSHMETLTNTISKNDNRKRDEALLREITNF